MNNYKKKYLSIISIVISSLLCASAMAQEVDSNEQSSKLKKAEDETEIIEIYGIINSLKKSLSVKRDSVNIVDSIFADDIGKLPDVNIADALSRISGITVNRNDYTGQAQSINVRGLAGGFVTTTLNGRKLATTDSGRDFSYDVLSSGIISSMEVAKSPLANLASGGIGGNIEIKTVRPLNREGTDLVLKLDDSYQELSGEHNPQLSAYFNHNMDDTFGVAVGVIHSTFGNRTDTASVKNLWRDRTVEVDNGINDIYEVTADVPDGMAYKTGTVDSERNSINLSLQWRPTNELDITFDGLYSTFDQTYEESTLSLRTYSFLDGTKFTDIRVNEHGVVDYIAIEGKERVALENWLTSRETSTQSYGLNLAYTLDELTLTADISHSVADKSSGDQDVQHFLTETVVSGAVLDFTAGHVLPDVQLGDEVNADSEFTSYYTALESDGSNDQVDQIMLDGEWTPDIEHVSAIKFGVGYTKQTKTTERFWPGERYAFFHDKIAGKKITDESLLMTALPWLKIPSSVFSNGEHDDYMTHISSEFPRIWPSIDGNALLDFYKGLDTDAYNSLESVKDESDSYEIEEALQYAYIMADFEGELLGHEFGLNVGGRFIQVDITAQGISQFANVIPRDETGRPINNDYRTETKVSKTGNDSYFLPSLTFNWKLFDDYIVKIAAAKTVSRPNLSEMRPYEWIDASPDIKKNTISRSNPALEPFSAISADVSLEWYFSETGAVALGLYYKDIDGYVSDATSIEEIDGWDFIVTMPVNNEEHSKVKGLEVSWQQSLDQLLPAELEGFGFNTNLTYTDTKNGDQNALGWDVGFVGMSRISYNMMFYYEVDKFSTRLAISHRDEYLTWVTSYEDDRDDYESASDYVDWSASYDVTDNIGFIVSVNNLTNQGWGQTKHEVYGQRVRNIGFAGRTYNLGVKATF